MTNDRPSNNQSEIKMNPLHECTTEIKSDAMATDKCKSDVQSEVNGNQIKIQQNDNSAEDY